MNPSNCKTVWEHEEKKWKPRTYQAAKVFFPAHDIHRPPEEEKKPVFALTQSEIFEIESMHRKERIKKMAAETTALQALNDAKREAQETKRWRKKLSRFKSKQAKKISRVVDKQALALRREAEGKE